MNTLMGTLTPEQVTHYHQYGYVVLRRVIDSDTLAFACKTIDDFIREHPDQVQYEAEALQGRPGVTAEDIQLASRGAPPNRPWYETAFASIEERILAVRGIHQRVYRDDRFRRLAAHPPLVSALVSLLGEHIKVLQDMALIKPPKLGSEKPHHQDAAYFEIEPHDQVVGTWWALDPATIENGCMCVWPGTHRWPVIEHADMKTKEGMPHRAADPANLDESQMLPLPMDAGDVLLFSSHLFHYTPPNRSNQRRRALQIHYASAHCRVVPGKKPRTYTLVHGQSQPHGL
jgi:phytanoyl-CoA hydroxylase